MKLEQSISALNDLGEFMLSEDNELAETAHRAYARNKWLTVENVSKAMRSIASQFLGKGKLEEWLQNYPALTDRGGQRSIGVVAAGNIPLVAFHDVLSVLISGHLLKLKLSEKSDVLLPFLLDKLCEIEPRFRERIELVERLTDFDAVIATGSNNSSRYFEYYFSKVPNIIRRNRNSLAVLTGNESHDELRSLGHDVFDYFGLGCRNVSKLYLPQDYDQELFKIAFGDFEYLSDHNQYRNNLDYNRTLLLMNGIPFLNMDFINITENPLLSSPIANLHYEHYTSLDLVKTGIAAMEDQIQCIVGNIEGLCTVPFGKTQQPGLMDYADGVDTLEFLTELGI